LLTLNQIIDQITDLATAHSQIQESGVGTIAELQAKERNYPLLWVFHENTEINEGYLTSNIQIIVADRVITGEEGDDTEYSEQEILSDTQLILLDFINYFQQQHAQEYTVDKSALLAPFTETWNDRVAGNTCVMRLNQFYEHNKCWIPESGAAIPPSVDGLTLYDFCDATVFARLTDAQEACLTAALCSTCADATTQVNGTNVGTVASGGTWNQEIHDSAGADVGTDANPSVISDSINEVNGVDISDPTVAEGTHNQEIHDTAGADVGTDANPSVIADANVRNNATPTWTDTVKAEDTLTLAQGKALDSDGATTLLADYIPVASGFMFTCSTPSAPSLSVSVDDSTPDYYDSILITATPTEITPTSYTFLLPDKNGNYQEVTQAGNTYSWNANNIGTNDIIVTCTDGSDNTENSVSITTTIDIPLTDGKGVFSFFKLVDSYAGDCVRIRRSSDSTETDIGFSNSVIDEAAIETFVGTSYYQVVKVYNQVSNGDIHQSTANLQPHLQLLGNERFLQGYLNSDSSRWSVTFTSGYSLNETSSEYVVFKTVTDGAANARILGSTGDVRNVSAGYISANTIAVYDGTNSLYTNSHSSAVKHLLTSEIKTGDPSISVNGVDQPLTAFAGSAAAFTAKANSTLHYFTDSSGGNATKSAPFFCHISEAEERNVQMENILMSLYDL